MSFGGTGRPGKDRPAMSSRPAAQTKTAAAFAVALALAGCGTEVPPAKEPHVFQGPTMGTRYTVKVVADELPAARRETLTAAIEAELEDVNAKMSTYRDDSELSRFNASAIRDPFTVSAATFEVVQAALEVGRMTGGAFDITVGPLVNAWGFGPQIEGRSLRAEEVRSLLERIGSDKLLLWPEEEALSKTRPDLYCDLSGIAKGYAVDRVAGALAAQGLSDFWVEVGGEVRAAGKNGAGELWRAGIERPQLLPGAVQRIVGLDGRAMATSGDYRNYRERDGVRFSHIIDPRSGWPISHRLASVSVVHPQCMIADALATGLMVMGPREGYAMAEREGLAVLFLVRDGEGFRELMTPAFEELPPGGGD